MAAYLDSFYPISWELGDLTLLISRAGSAVLTPGYASAVSGNLNKQTKQNTRARGPIAESLVRDTQAASPGDANTQPGLSPTGPGGRAARTERRNLLERVRVKSGDFCRILCSCSGAGNAETLMNLKLGSNVVRLPF